MDTCSRCGNHMSPLKREDKCTCDHRHRRNMYKNTTAYDVNRTLDMYDNFYDGYGYYDYNRYVKDKE